MVYFFHFIQILIEPSVANCGEPFQTPRSAASDLVLHCLPLYHEKTLGLNRLKEMSC